MTILHRVRASLVVRTALMMAYMLVIGGQLYNHHQWLQEDHFRTEQQRNNILQLLGSTRLLSVPSSTVVESPLDSNATSNNRDTFGACLMFKDDMDLLPEWLAYHYTILPLRHLILGVDIGNEQDPRQYLEQWGKASLELHYKVVSMADLMTVRQANNNRLLRLRNNNPLLSNSSGTSALDAHHAFVDRQKLFVQQCTLDMQTWNVHWTTYIDSDEFITYNNFGDGDNDQEHTVLASLQKWQAQGVVTSPCYTLPRLRYGALENVTCPASPSLSSSNTYFSEQEWSLTTRRFVQHAQPGHFASNKFGKVILNVTALPKQLVQDKLPRNIHRPYPPYCGPAAAGGTKARLRANHYVGSLDRFTARTNDARRTQAEWHVYAWHKYNASCHDVNMQSWVARFVKIVKNAALAQTLLFG